MIVPGGERVGSHSSDSNHHRFHFRCRQGYTFTHIISSSSWMAAVIQFGQIHERGIGTIVGFRESGFCGRLSAR